MSRQPHAFEGRVPCGYGAVKELAPDRTVIITGQKNKGNIMVVDDQPANLKLLEDMLRQQGYRVRSFPRGRLALLAAAQQPPDLILLDITMPEMDGYEVCRQLKSDERLSRIPVIFLSALGDTADKVKAFQSGGVDYVTKPFHLEEVQARVHTHIELRHLQLESERRAAQELEIAKQVQARLFPQILPSLATLDCAGICIQARQVGGDCYDFLELARDRLGLVISDIAGKGIAGALLMASLQANLRSQCAIALDQPQRFLRSVNQLFYKNTAGSAYATLFFAEYDDKAGRLRYANCGHPPALLLRSDNSLERLGATATVLGLFEEWDCSIDERQLFPGDALALYTDGVTESFNDVDEEFGERRLIAALRRHRELSSPALLAAIVDEVRQFSTHTQHDDITLMVAKCRGN
jgi:serine phosphatase RsbU (regulator of sigma subunit)